MGRVLGLCGPCHVDVVRTWAALSQSSKALRGLMLTASQDVKELEISDSWVTMESMDGVATTFTGLTSVKLVSTISSFGNTDAGLQHVAKLTNLATLSLSSHSITNAGLRHVTKLASLNKLVLNDCYRIRMTSAGYQPVL